ncbi:MAG TPA: fatty-acid oxidation protein subunit alpha [Chloroflexi bacterium]|nr:fatty-acid oxidation protein subunit alpha [Chloroflexota bacterium]HHW86649.1 fatty-acid oxidation protein subunit alpha [Chloroflexota bacterium]
MPARDLFHQAVKNALVRDGWVITHDPLHIEFGSFDFFIDLGAESLIGANRDGVQIAVEVKSFAGASSLSDFHTAVGQFVNYRLVLGKTDPERVLYLAVAEFAYVSLLGTEFGQLAIEAHQLKLIVFDEEQGVVTQWIE